MLIDDHADALEALAVVLELEGAHVDTRPGAAQALAQLKRQLSDVEAIDARGAMPVAILCDIEMPVIDGFAFLKRLRVLEATYRLPPVPVLAVTARVQPLECARVLAAGFAAHVPKPVDVRALIDRLAKEACC